MIKAIPTRYAGCHFRSRLEARWAVFFDHLGIRWEYEPQGYALPSGNYLPDFWVSHANGHFLGASGNNWFAEIKPQVTIPTDRRWAELCAGTGYDVIVFFGPPSLQTLCHTFWLSGEGNAWSKYAPILPHNAFAGLVEMEPQILRASDAARSARFEHGQSGSIQ